MSHTEEAKYCLGGYRACWCKTSGNDFVKYTQVGPTCVGIAEAGEASQLRMTVLAGDLAGSAPLLALPLASLVLQSLVSLLVALPLGKFPPLPELPSAHVVCGADGTGGSCSSWSGIVFSIGAWDKTGWCPFPWCATDPTESRRGII